MTRRPTPAVYRRRRLVVALGVVVVLVLLVWLGFAAVGALGSHSNAAAQASASVSASAEADNTPTISVPAVPVGGKCAAGDLVVQPVAAMAHVNGPVALAFSVYTKQNPECVWHVSRSTVNVTVFASGSQVFWSTSSCPGAIKVQDIVVRQGTPTTVTLATWNGQASDAQSTCGPQNAWATPGIYRVFAASSGGDPSSAPLQMVAPGVPLVQPSGAPTASPSTTASGTPRATATSKPSAKTTVTPSSRPTPTAVQTF